MSLLTVCVKWASPGHSGRKGSGFYPLRAHSVRKSDKSSFFTPFIEKNCCEIPIPLDE